MSDLKAGTWGSSSETASWFLSRRLTLMLTMRPSVIWDITLETASQAGGGREDADGAFRKCE
jgi:hypothetical protein